MPTLGQTMRENAKKRKEEKEKLAKLEELLADLPEEVVKRFLTDKGLLSQPDLKTDVADEMVRMMTGIVKKQLCPSCGSSVIQKFGKDKRGYPRYRCTACGKTFGIQKGSLVSRSSWTYEMWIVFIQQTMMGQSLKNIQHIFDTDLGVAIKEETLLSYRHKLMRAIMLYWPMPQLRGTVQVDETFFRENQKGVRELINVAPNVISIREARTPWNKVAAKYGIQGPEFSCAVVGVDSLGHTVAIMTGLGRNSAEPFETYFSEYLGAVDFLCTDGFPVYDWYCEGHNIAHYVQISTYRDVIKAKQKEVYDRKKYKISEAEVRRMLYGKREIDYLDYYNKQLSFDSFEALKREKDLGLIHVDRTHKQIKNYINHQMTGVATIYLQRYLAFYCFRHNWAIDHNGSFPTSRQDAEEILYTLNASGEPFVTNTENVKPSFVELRKVSTRYVTMLARATDELREKAQHRGLFIDDGDTLVRFNKWEYFRTAPVTQLRAIAKEKHIPKYTTMTPERLAREIYHLDNRDEIFLKLIAADGNHSKYMDDLQALIEKTEQQ